MRRGKVFSTLTAGLLLAGVAAGAATAEQPLPPKQPPQTLPQQDQEGFSGSSLSKRLDRSGGIIRPPADIDPQIAQPPPAVPPQSTPIVPPPGTPGGNPSVKPK